MPRPRTAVLLVALAAGCAHDRGQYAFAPPLAPPVYPQPPGYATPQVAPGPVPAPLAAAPAPTLPGAIASAAADPCAGVLAADGTVIEAPCPPSGEIVSDGVVVAGATGPFVVVDQGVSIDPGIPCDEGVVVP